MHNARHELDTTVQVEKKNKSRGSVDGRARLLGVLCEVSSAGRLGRIAAPNVDAASGPRGCKERPWHLNG